MGGPDKDGLVVQAPRGHASGAALERLRLLADPARLFLAVPVADQAHLLAALRLGPERLAKPPGIRCDQTRGGGQDVFGRPVVLFQPDHLGAGEVLFEAQDVADLGAAPAVDRLIVVADAADVLVPRRQQPEPEILRDVRILIFIDQNEAKPPLILLQNVNVLLEDRHHMQKQIAEVAGVQRQQAGLVLLVNLAHRPLVTCTVSGCTGDTIYLHTCRANTLGTFSSVLVAINNVCKPAFRPFLPIYLLCLKNLPD